MTENQHRSGFVGLVGLPNAGKSTLMNQLMGMKLSIISPKPQTTRNRIMGVLNGEHHQLAVVDTPGIHRPRGRLHQAMVRTAQDVIPDMDLVCWVLDMRPSLTRLERNQPIMSGGLVHIVELLKKASKVIVALNKIDGISKPKLLPVIQALATELPNAELIPISARTGSGVTTLIDSWIKSMPHAPPLFSKETFTDVTERFLVSELIREKIFHLTNQEIPYSTAVEVQAFEEKDGRIEIFARIWVERDSQKGIIIGQGGQRLKEIGTRARRDIQKMLDSRVHLDLQVSLMQNWSDDPRRLRSLGFESGQ
ncbi:MAG: GTPase Era [Myxococcota bacterium]